MLEPKTSIPLLYTNGKASTYGINIGKYPQHCYIGDLPRKIFPELPLTVDFCRRDEWIEGCYRKCVRYELCTVEMVEQGSLLLVQNGECCRINPGELYLLHRGGNHEVLADQSAVKKITVAFGGNMVEQLLQNSGLAGINKITPDKPERFLRLWNELLAELRQREDGFQLRCSALAYNVLLEIGRCRSYDNMPPLIVEAMIMMDRLVDRQVSIAALCRNLCTSPATLNRVFRKHLHLPPMEYFIRLKMNSACIMLRHTNYSIKQIAEQTGYSNQLYFSAEFRKRIGLSPKHYRHGNAAIAATSGRK